MHEQDPYIRASRDIATLTLRRRGVANAPTAELAAHHSSFTTTLGTMLRYAASRNGQRCVPLSYGIHHRLLQFGSLTDVHCHLAVYVERGAEGDEALQWLVEYLTGKFEVFVSAERHCADDLDAAGAVAAYEEAGFSIADESGCTPSLKWLKTYVRQCHIDHHLHCRMTLGPLRKHVGRLKEDRLQPFIIRHEMSNSDVVTDGKDSPQSTLILSTTVNRKSLDLPLTQTGNIILQLVTTDYIKHLNSPLLLPRPIVIYKSIRHRPPRNPRRAATTPGPRILCASLSWFGDELSPSIAVRGWDRLNPARSWERVNKTYNLTRMLNGARDSCRRVAPEQGYHVAQPTGGSGLAGAHPAYISLKHGCEVVFEDANTWQRFGALERELLVVEDSEHSKVFKCSDGGADTLFIDAAANVKTLTANIIRNTCM